MRKKSHISVASYLLNCSGMEVLSTHKKALYIGSILPDCMPSFITRRHSIDETFSIFKKELKLLIEDYNYNKGITSYFCRHLGIILHYVADYFTYPHNSFYSGNIRQHCSYEKEMKFYMRAYIKSKEAKRTRSKEMPYNSVDAICHYIMVLHKRYEQQVQNIALDCEYIVSLCHQITDFILSVFEKNTFYRMAMASS